MEDDELKERIKIIQHMRSNPCADNEHEYVDMMFAPDNQAGTMLNVVCKKCFDVQGWIYR
jgi:hypothetical protein